MIENENSRLIHLAVKVLNIFSAHCSRCNYTFDYAMETADSDMLSCYCGSVYSLKDEQLVIAPLTAEEFYNGQSGRLDMRINAICPNHGFQYFGNRICSYCGEAVIQKSQKGFSLKEYCILHPNTLIIYTDRTIRILKEELEVYCTEI